MRRVPANCSRRPAGGPGTATPELRDAGATGRRDGIEGRNGGTQLGATVARMLAAPSHLTERSGSSMNWSSSRDDISRNTSLRCGPARLALDRPRQDNAAGEGSWPTHERAQLVG